MSEFERVGALREFPEGRGRAVKVDGILVAIFRTNDGVFALRDGCPHMGASLADGKIHDGRVTCFWHGWTFSLSDGLCSQKRQNCAKVYDVELRDGDVYVRPPAPPAPKADDAEEWIVFDPDKHLK